MIISISGQAGSGKSSVAKELAQSLNLKHYSMGDLRRKMAQNRNITLAELNELGEKRDFTDKQVDEYQKELAKKENNFIVDGRLSYYFIPDSIKIFLKAHLRIRAERVYNDERDEEKFRDIGDAIASLIERENSDKSRYSKYYNLDCMNELQYDLVLDTTYLSIEEVKLEVQKFIKTEKIIT
jgi:cytidylate kinase